MTLWRYTFLSFIAVLAVSDEVRAYSDKIRGVPYTRLYSYEDIGGISSGVGLSFDYAGRLGLAQDGTYALLNDDVWLSVVRRDPHGVQVRHVQSDVDGTAYYGAVGSWGLLELLENGNFKPVSLAPQNRPSWTASTEFTQIIPSSEGVYFGSSDGVVYWSRETGRSIFRASSELITIFKHAGSLYLSEYGVGVKILDIETGNLVQTHSDVLAEIIVAHSARLSADCTVLASHTNELYRFVNDRLVRLPFPPGPSLGGHITTLVPLPEGDFAVAVVGRGLFVISLEGEIRLHLSGSEYQRITANISNEPGVLWAANENGILKILYGEAVTRVGQNLGLPVGWPQIVNWKDRTVVASDGRIYEASEVGVGQQARFRQLEGQPEDGGWGLAAWDDWLFVGNRIGLFAKRSGSAFENILPGFDVARAITFESGVCIAISSKEIAALRWDGENWNECAPRISGVGYPAFAHAAKESAWLELGANLVYRITLDAGEIVVNRIDSFPWSDPRWIHVSVLGETIVLSGPESGRVFFDETSEQIFENDSLDALLYRSTKHWPARIHKDENGMYWVSHAHGVSLVGSDDNPPRDAVARYRIIDEYIPRIHEISTEVVAVSTGRSLYMLDQSMPGIDRSRFKPMIVSVKSARVEEGPYLVRDFADGVRLPYSRNSLNLRFFSGSYGLPRRPVYEFRVNTGDWRQMDGSVLLLSNLSEGDYDLDVRLTDAQGSLGEPLGLSFSVNPPWTRTWKTRLVVVLLALSGLVLGAKLLMRRARHRHAVLQQEVDDRTTELKETLTKLEQETRTSATLAERNRLAAEIHDSLEQGFSALILQLEVTSNLSACPSKVQTGLTIARNMVAFNRDEVREAVWDLHSPRLNSGGLAEAIRRVVDQTIPDSIESSLRIEGEPKEFGSKIEHHLLRIAQEAIANSVKHSSSNHIDVCLEYEATEIRLSIEDDGVGFDLKALSQMSEGHFGIKYLKTRSMKIGAKLDIISKINIGTLVAIVVSIVEV